MNGKYRYLSITLPVVSILMDTSLYCYFTSLTTRFMVVDVVCKVILTFPVCPCGYPGILLTCAVNTYSHKGVGFPWTWCALIVGSRLVGGLLVLHLGTLGVPSSGTFSFWGGVICGDFSAPPSVISTWRRIRFIYLFQNVSLFCRKSKVRKNLARGGDGFRKIEKNDFPYFSVFGHQKHPYIGRILKKSLHGFIHAQFYMVITGPFGRYQVPSSQKMWHTVTASPDRHIQKWVRMRSDQCLLHRTGVCSLQQ